MNDGWIGEDIWVGVVMDRQMGQWVNEWMVDGWMTQRTIGWVNVCHFMHRQMNGSMNV